MMWSLLHLDPVAQGLPCGSSANPLDQRHLSHRVEGGWLILGKVFAFQVGSRLLWRVASNLNDSLHHIEAKLRGVRLLSFACFLCHNAHHRKCSVELQERSRIPGITENWTDEKYHLRRHRLGFWSFRLNWPFGCLDRSWTDQFLAKEDRRSGPWRLRIWRRHLLSCGRD